MSDPNLEALRLSSERGVPLSARAIQLWCSSEFLTLGYQCPVASLASNFPLSTGQPHREQWAALAKGVCLGEFTPPAGFLPSPPLSFLLAAQGAMRSESR